MKDTENIEKLFKETFEHFEADVTPQVWTNVQSGINSGLGSAASTAAKLTIGKIIAGVVALTVVAGGVWYFSQSEKNTNYSVNNNQPKTEKVSNEPVQNIVLENKSEETVSDVQNKQSTASSHSSNSNVSVNSQQGQEISIGSAEIVVSSSGNSSQENTTFSSSEPMHKYGNATQDDGGMMRGNKIQNVKSGSLKDNSSSSDENDTESDLPTANIFVNTTSGNAPLTVEFINQGVVSSLNWDFGDGATSRENSPTHTFDKAGNYEVILTAKNSSGSATARVTIEVKSVSGIGTIPNIFTPNGDGENDLFFFELKNINSIGVAIYSQKEGGLVYQWNSLDGNWNGKKMMGDDAPEGVYIYSIQAIGIDGVPHSEGGFVTLSRKR